MPNLPTDCPCGSNTLFSQCCAPLINGEPAPTAAALMRSRYTAYSLSNTGYLIRTTHPQQQSRVRQQQVYQQASDTLWQRLEILSCDPIDEQTGTVEFKAWFTANGKQQVHQEHSTFLKVDSRWFFIYPGMALTVSRNAPCPCGSGKKYKKCCA